MSKAVRYAFEEALSGLLRRRVLTVVSVATIGASLGVFGLFFSIARAGGSLVDSLASKVQVVVYLSPDLSAPARQALVAKIKAQSVVMGVEERTADEALARFKSLFPDLAAIPEEIGETPFPPSIEISLKPELARAQVVANLIESWKKIDGVDEVHYDAILVNRLSAVVSLVRGLALVLGLVLAVASGFTIANVIRLSVYSREDEIEIMRLVGASKAFIRGPFLVEGSLSGAMGGLLASALLALVLRRVVEAMRSANLGATMAPTLASSDVFALIGIGAAVGLLGSFVSLGKLRD
ncbi:MAG: ABC transporter permease [Vicinamibacteria bacterium]|jgi:cell division transport system permease protein|nr:ABC transporter permease [Vicinamibacteria bacterium]MBP9944846.1 ABC transporter permease [Vicinamibacteria bacterium]